MSFAISLIDILVKNILDLLFQSILTGYFPVPASQSPFDQGCIISADGMLYIYDERKGNIGLLKANPEKFDLISSFQVTPGESGPFRAHPVIHNGILNLRHRNALMAYNIKAN